MRLPKIIIFDVGGTLIKGIWNDSILGYKYLYDEILDVRESLDDYLEFVTGMFPVIKQRETCDLEFSFHSFFNYLKDVYGLKSDLPYEEIEYKFARCFYEPILNDHVIELLDYLKSNSSMPIEIVISNSSMNYRSIYANKLKESDIRVLSENTLKDYENAVNAVLYEHKSSYKDGNVLICSMKLNQIVSIMIKDIINSRNPIIALEKVEQALFLTENFILAAINGEIFKTF